MKVSVIICTYNRTDLLEASLHSVCMQEFPTDQFEIIVVDNNSTDGTKALVEKFSSSPIRITYLFEERQGLSYARNTGIESANGEIVVFTDDDIRAEESWLANLVSAFGNPDVACAGGPIRAVWPFHKPEWLSEEWVSYLTVSEFSAVRETGEFRDPHYPWGANIAFRKEVFTQIGKFPTGLGRIGKSLLSNEEINLCKMIEKDGKKIQFVSDAIIHHVISPNRLTRQWFHHRTYHQGISDAILDFDSTGDCHLRLRTLVSSLFWQHVRKDASDFGRECSKRILIGYLHQLISAQQGNIPSNSVRTLRVLQTLLSSILDKMSTQMNERDQRISQLESRPEGNSGLNDEITRHQRQIDELTAQLSATQQDVAQRWGDIAYRDGRIRQMNEEITRSVARQDELGNALQEHAVALAIHREQSQQHSGELAHAHELRCELEKQLELISAENCQLGNRLEQSATDMAERDELIRQLKEEVTLARELRGDLEGKLQQKSVELTDREERSRQIDAEIIQESLRIEAEMQVKEEMLKSQANDLQSANNRLRVTEEDLFRIRLDNEADRHSFGQHLKEIEQQLAEKEQRIEDLLTSKSWKITAPLRAILDLTKGGN